MCACLIEKMSFVADLGKLPEVLQLSSEGQHSETGHYLVYLVIWVRKTLSASALVGLVITII